MSQSTVLPQPPTASLRKSLYARLHRRSAPIYPLHERHSKHSKFLLHLTVYVDDTAIFASSRFLRNATKYIQAHLDKLQEYFRKWKLTVNPAKTQAITFINKRLKPTDQVIISGQNLPWTSTIKYIYTWDTLNTKIT